jgi:hypothetical protein
VFGKKHTVHTERHSFLRIFSCHVAILNGPILFWGICMRSTDRPWCALEIRLIVCGEDGGTSACFAPEKRVYAATKASILFPSAHAFVVFFLRPQCCISLVGCEAGNNDVPLVDKKNKFCLPNFPSQPVCFYCALRR